MKKYIFACLMCCLPLTGYGLGADGSANDQVAQDFIESIFQAAANPTACKANGFNCRFSFDCCSNTCYQGTCGSVTSCKADGANCRYGHECCSRSCNYRGRCGAISCLPRGASCQYGHECCSRSCDYRGDCR